MKITKTLIYGFDLQNGQNGIWEGFHTYSNGTDQIKFGFFEKHTFEKGILFRTV